MVQPPAFLAARGWAPPSLGRKERPWQWPTIFRTRAPTVSDCPSLFFLTPLSEYCLMNEFVCIFRLCQNLPSPHRSLPSTVSRLHIMGFPPRGQPVHRLPFVGCGWPAQFDATSFFSRALISRIFPRVLPANFTREFYSSQVGFLPMHTILQKLFSSTPSQKIRYDPRLGSWPLLVNSAI